MRVMPLKDALPASSIREEHLTRLRIILVKYHPATNTRPSKILLTDPRNNNKRKTIPYDQSGPKEALDQAEEYLRKIGIIPVGITSVSPNGYYCALLTENFHTPLS